MRDLESGVLGAYSPSAEGWRGAFSSGSIVTSLLTRTRLFVHVLCKIHAAKRRLNVTATKVIFKYHHGRRATLDH